MSDHKHVELTSYVTIGVDADHQPITVKHEAVMDVPVDQLDAFVADASGRWQDVRVSDDCPEHCVAQLTTHPDKREAAVAKAAKLREAHDERQAKAAAAFQKKASA